MEIQNKWWTLQYKHIQRQDSQVDTVYENTSVATWHLDTPAVMCSFSAKAAYVQTYIITHAHTNSLKIIMHSININSVETSKIWQKNRKRGSKTRSKQSSKQSMPDFWHRVDEINGKLDRMWEMCVFAINSPLWCFLSAWNEWEVVKC